MAPVAAGDSVFPGTRGAAGESGAEESAPLYLQLMKLNLEKRVAGGVL